MIVPPASSTSNDPAGDVPRSRVEIRRSRRRGRPRCRRDQGRPPPVAGSALHLRNNVAKDGEIGVEKAVGLERKTGCHNGAFKPLSRLLMSTPSAVPPGAVAARRTEDIVLNRVENDSELDRIPSSATRIEIANCGIPWMKLVVPSRGSIIQVGPGD